jgi:hypothetical protein
VRSNSDALPSLFVGRVDIKSDNLWVSLRRSTPEYEKAIEDFILEHPSTSYPPKTEKILSNEPIITVRSEPLPNFGLLPDLSNLHALLGDFGMGEHVVLFRRFGLSSPNASSIASA